MSSGKATNRASPIVHFISPRGKPASAFDVAVVAASSVAVGVSFNVSPTCPHHHRARSPRRNICRPGSWTWPARNPKTETKESNVGMCVCAHADDVCMYVCVCVCVCGRLYVLAKQARQSGNRTEEDPNETQYLSGGVWYVRAIPCTIKAQICTNTNAHT